MKLLAQRGQARTLARSEETVVADFDEAFGKDMLQKAVEKLFGGQGAEPGLP